MKLFRLLIAVALLLSFVSGIALAQDAAAPAAGGDKKSVEEKKAERDKNQAKRDEAFKKRIEKITEMITKIEAAIAENKINEKQKAKMLENFKKRIELSEMIVSEMKENLKMIEEHIKIAEETRNKAKGVYDKLNSYTPPVKEDKGATPAVPASEKK
jgi:TolA-binding protein